MLLVHGLDVQIINAATGDILRELTINLADVCQPRGARPRHGNGSNPHFVGSSHSDVVRPHSAVAVGLERALARRCTGNHAIRLTCGDTLIAS